MSSSPTADRGIVSVVARAGAEKASVAGAVANVVEIGSTRTGWTGAPAAIRRGPAASRRIDPRLVALWVRLGDALVAAAAGAAAYRLQPGLHWPPDPVAAFAALAVLALLVRFSAGEPTRREWLHDRLSDRLARAALRTLLPFAVSLGVAAALVPTGDALRGPLTEWLVLWAIGAATGVCGIRLCLSAAVARWRRQGRLRQAIAVFGAGDLGERLLARLQAVSADAIELVGVFDDRDRQRIANPGLRSLTRGTGEDLVALSRRRAIDRVLVALPHSAADRLGEVVGVLRRMPVEISLAPDLAGYDLPCRGRSALGGLPLVAVHGQPLGWRQALLKSAVDKTLATLALIGCAPLLLFLAIAIKLDSKGPVLFRQNRYGFGDRLIRVYKFRTMTADAADDNGEVQARPNDPRVTRLGRFLRRWSLDELPQLINVLRGEMSLVGPRPHAVGMRVEARRNHDIVPDYALRHHMKPGITGWAQVNGHHGPVASTEALCARVRYDFDYINNWSLWFDLRILLRTVKIVVRQRHAC